MKDSKNSWQQRSWEYAAASHARWLETKSKLTNPELIATVDAQLKDLEAKYPKLLKS